MRHPEARFFAALRMTVLVLFCISCSGARIERTVKQADALRGAQQFDAALKSYQDLTQRFPDKLQLAAVYLRIGDLYFYNLKKNDEAVANYQVVVQKWPLTPESAQAYQRLAELYTQDERYDRAIEMYENLLKYFPNHSEAPQFMRNIGLAYLKQKNYNQARIELQKIVATPNVAPEIMAGALYDMGETYFLEGDETRAIGFYRRMISQFPNSTLVPMAKLQMAVCYEELKDLPAAMALENELRRANPENDAIKAKLQQMEKRRRDMNRPQMLPWDRKVLMKGQRQ